MLFVKVFEHALYEIAFIFFIVGVEPTTPRGNCSNGEVRLAGGNATLGRVEVCINNAWGTVCNSRFGTNEARVICGQLGFSNTGIIKYFHPHPSPYSIKLL